jgi:two-component system chemotaxis response regulator CheB
MGTERVVVAGASAGGVGALESVVRGLPRNFPAAVLIVLHMAPTRRSLLPQILSRRAALPVAQAADGEPLEPGRIYIAPPDRHLLVDDDRVKITRGPRENHSRPSIDVLFRSAAYHFGARAIGVVLSGTLSDGSSGLAAIRRLGGVAVIQDPDEAVYTAMPLNAMRRVDIDYALPAAELGGLLSAIVREPTRAEPLDAEDYRRDLKVEIDIAATDSAFERGIMEYGEPSVYTCPECNGVLFRIRDGGKLDRFRCHTGHAFSSAALLDQLTESTEATLWQAVKSLQEASALLNETASRLRETGDVANAETLVAQARALEQRLNELRSMALDHAGMTGSA